MADSLDFYEIEAIMEGILFAAGEPVAIDRLAAVVGAERADVEKAALALSDGYDYDRRGIRLIRLEDSLQLCTRTEYADYIRRALETRKAPQLSQAALEVLAIIAYRQPVTKAYIEQVRGVDSSNTVNTLAEKGLIEECGRLDVPGRPMLFRTTDDFLRSFGLSGVADLPPLSQFQEEIGEQLTLLTEHEEPGM